MTAGSKKSKPAKDELKDALISLGSTMGLNKVFTKFLELTATAFGADLDPANSEEREQQYEDALKGLSPDVVSKFAQMTALLCLAVRENEDNPVDILGDIYHSLRLNNEWNGQYFTPDDIARMMAMIINAASEPSSTEDYVTINEPACGSGTMVIGCIWAMLRKGFDYQRKALFVAQDIDIRCVWMAYIQLTLYKVPAIVIHGNTLTMEEWSRWYTPYAIPLLLNRTNEEAAV